MTKHASMVAILNQKKSKTTKGLTLESVPSVNLSKKSTKINPFHTYPIGAAAPTNTRNLATFMQGLMSYKGN